MRKIVSGKWKTTYNVEKERDDKNSNALTCNENEVILK